MIGIPVSFFRRKRRVSLILGLASLVLCLAILQSEYLWIGPPFDDLSRFVYRIAFFIVMPFRVFVVPFFPKVDHHWTLAHHLVATIGAPWFYYAVYRQVRRFIARRKALTFHRQELVRDSLIDRRQFLTRSATGSFGLAVTGFTGYSTLVEPQSLSVERYTVPIQDLPPRFEGLRIVQLSDTHYGPYTAGSFIERVLARAQELNPDFIALTGDYVHFTQRAIPEGLNLFEPLRARYGVVAVLGNHDHWENGPACTSALESVGIPCIDNKRLFLTAKGLSDSEDFGDSICIGGVGDLWEDRVQFEQALRGASPITPRIVLSHNPDTAELIQQHQRVDLMLSGHTHGGQISLPKYGPPVLPSKFGRKYLGGLCEGPRCRVIVSRGVGLAGVPLRFRVQPEIVEITLQRA